VELASLFSILATTTSSSALFADGAVGLVRCAHGVAIGNPEVLLGKRRHLREVEAQLWEVAAGVSRPQPDGRVGIVDERVGHVVVQRLPIWLPRVRVDARNQFSMAGWFSENYLPYRRPPGPSSWPALPEGPALPPR